MFEGDRIWMAQGDVPCNLLLGQANRHGLIAGASGTGKTVTMKVMAEGFSKAGVPVFLVDAKGDVRGICQPGEDSEKMQQRIANFGIQNWRFEGTPCRFWNVLEGDGMPTRVTVSDMGPTLLARLLGLTDVQEGVLNVVFRVADDNQLLLIDLKDLRSMLNYVAENAKEIEITYGRVSSASVGAILRALIAIEDQGGDLFFGEPSLELNDWFSCDDAGQGYVNILDARGLIQSPQIYSMFLLWMMSELFETLPEVGDLDKPKLVFFFDEAHLLFNDMPKELLNKIVQVVKLIRSKGVGVYFITQSPSDIPDEVLAQLSNRVQHGLRAYTPSEQKAVRAAAQAFRVNPTFKSEDAIMELGTGEALVSFLDESGRPSIVEKARILPPQCLMAAPDARYVDAVIAGQADLMNKYATAVDRTSAYEVLAQKDAEESPSDASPKENGTAETGVASKEASEPETPSNATGSRPKFCSECGASLDAGSNFCGACGTKVAALSSPGSMRISNAPATRASSSAKPITKNASSEAKGSATKKSSSGSSRKKESEASKAAGRFAAAFGREASRQLTRGLLGALRK